MTVEDKGAYAGTVSGTFTIAQAEASATVTARSGLVYTGAAQELVTASGVTGGAITYSVDGGAYGSSVPTGTVPKTYEVVWKVSGDANHSDKSGSVSVTISGTVSGANTITLGAGVTVELDGDDEVKVKEDCTVEVPEGSTPRVAVTEPGEEPGTTVTTTFEITGRATVDPTPEEGKVVEVDAENGGRIDRIIATLGDADGNITKVEIDEDGDVTTIEIDPTDENASIEKNKDGDFVVTGPATITLPTDPETVIEVPAGETVTVSPDGTITKDGTAINLVRSITVTDFKGGDTPNTWIITATVEMAQAPCIYRWEPRQAD